MPVSIRHQNAARKAEAQAPVTHVYEILDPHHRPDLNGEFAGQKVFMRGTKQCVRLSESQAKFYVDSGSIQLTD